MNGLTRRQVLAASLIALPFTLHSASAVGVDLVAEPRTFRLASKRYAYGLGFSNMFGAPLIRAGQGQAQGFRIHNKLSQPFRLIWSGIRGQTMQSSPLIAPGAVQSVQLLCPDAGVYAYRAETENGSDELAAQGLCGGVVAGGDSADVTLCIARPRIGFVPLPRLIAGHISPSTAVERWTLAHVDNPVSEAGEGSAFRINLVNISADSFIAVRFESAALTIVAVDGQPCPAFAPADGRIVLPPWGRVTLRADVLIQGLRALDELDGDKVLMQIPFSASAPIFTLPPPLDGNPSLPGAIPLENAVRATVEIGSTDTTLPLVKARTGQSIALNFHNPTAVAFSVHLQGHSARLIDALDDGWKPWWHDSVFVPPHDTTRLVFRAGNKGKYAIMMTALGEAAALLTYQRHFIID
jgi:hypothetical protein